jgi:hypothetical protein
MSDDMQIREPEEPAEPATPDLPAPEVEVAEEVLAPYDDDEGGSDDDPRTPDPA